MVRLSRRMRVTFLWPAQRKVTKRNAPLSTRLPPSTNTFWGPRDSTRLPAARNRRRHPWRRPFGLFPKGIRARARSTGDLTNSKNPFGRAAGSEEREVGVVVAVVVAVRKVKYPRMARPSLTPFWVSARRVAHRDVRDNSSRQEAAWNCAGPKMGNVTGVFAPFGGRVSLGTFFARAKKVPRPRCENRNK